MDLVAARLAMRTLGGEVVGGRWGRLPVRRELVGGVRGRLVAVLLCSTASRVVVKPHGQSRGLKLERGEFTGVHGRSRRRSLPMRVPD
jgi:hypothetical protein